MRRDIHIFRDAEMMSVEGPYLEFAEMLPLDILYRESDPLSSMPLKCMNLKIHDVCFKELDEDRHIYFAIYDSNIEHALNDLEYRASQRDGFQAQNERLIAAFEDLKKHPLRAWWKDSRIHQFARKALRLVGAALAWFCFGPSRTRLGGREP